MARVSCDESVVPDLCAPELIAELHALLWVNPKQAGTTSADFGWSCRDHVVVVGKMLLDRGAALTIRHGRAMFIQGPTSDGEPPVGLGQPPEMRPKSHSWLWGEEMGNIDLSANLAMRTPGWRPLDSPGVIGSQWVGPEGASFVECSDPSQYEQAVATATHRTDEAVAIYLTDAEEPFTAAVVTSGLTWAYSPLSLRLRQRRVAEDVYARAARHLELRLKGERRHLKGVSQLKAWQFLGDDPTLV